MIAGRSAKSALAEQVRFGELLSRHAPLPKNSIRFNAIDLKSPKKRALRRIEMGGLPC